MDLTELAAAFAALVVVGGTLYYLFRWQPVRKPWCVVLYNVSRETNANFNWPNPSGIGRVSALDEKLDQVVEELDTLPNARVLTFVKSRLLGVSNAPRGVDWEDVHLVYRAVWNDAPFRPPGKQMRARIVTWRPGVPTVPDDQSFATAGADDRDGFLQWVYQNCPADHYALFYWGHSIGPGGLFDLNNSVRFPPLPGAAGLAPASLIDVATTLRLLKNLRDHGAVTMTLRPSPVGTAAPSSGGTGLATSQVQSPQGPPAPGSKVDAVLFQDCWMATLETAFELQDLARYIVASQSLVPIGYTYTNGVMSAPTGPVWPYEALIGELLAKPNDFVDGLAGELKTFYADPAARAPFQTAAVSILDLGPGTALSTTVTTPIRDLVAALSMLSGGAYAEAFRWGFLYGGGKAYTLRPDGTLESGDWALRDVLRLCLYLSSDRNHPSQVSPAVSAAVKQAAADALKAIGPQAPGQYSLVRTAFTVPATTNALFEGVSILWMPGRYAAIPPRDEYLGKQIDNTFYGTLRLVTETKSTQGQGGDSWGTFAFEQLT